MKLIKNSIPWLLAVIAWIPCIAGETGNPPKVGETNYVVVKNAFFSESGILKQNAALLITDEKEIRENEKNFFNNNAYGHACGYHYDIQFWISTDKVIDDIPFNQDCEEFMKRNKQIQTRMQGYIKLLETKPTHYIYNLRLSAKTEPHMVIESFENSGLNLFFMESTSERYSSLTFTYRQIALIREQTDRSKWEEEDMENERNATRKMQSVIDSIRMISAIIEQSEISFPMQSFGGGKIEHEGQVTLKFENGTDLAPIASLVRRNGGETSGGYTPSHYYIQLVDASDDIETVRQKVKGYDIVSGTYEYPRRK